MVSDQVQFDLSGDLDEGNYKSCFARSVAVSSQYKQTKPPVVKIVEKDMDTFNNHFDKAKNVFIRSTSSAESPEIKLRKSTRSCVADSRRMSLGAMNSSRRSSICSSRVTEIPVENIVHQSKIQTLQWQLKEAEKSREMYRELMVQIVTFLERAHRSLELLGTKMNSKQTVSRSKSEHQIMADSSTLQSVNHSKTLDSTTCTEDYTAFRDFTWRRPKKQEISPEEIPPEKLSQEAFRLLRTAQSLLNTREPDLAHVNNEPEDDLEFLAQLAKEFPPTPQPEPKPQRTPSFSSSPKLITPERENKISNAFSRKLSLQYGEGKRYNMSRYLRQTDSARGSIVESENGNDFNKDHRASMISTHSYAAEKLKLDCEKSSSPPAGSISSVEDESGFSSMNSFQDVGLPLVSSTISEDVNSKNVIIRNMIQNNVWNANICNHSSGHNSHHNSHLESVEEKQPIKDNLDDIKLWKKPDNIMMPNHKRWSSTPVKKNDKQTREVLWV